MSPTDNKSALRNMLSASDTLADARHLCEAVYMATESLDMREANALQAVVVAMQAKLELATEAISQSVADMQPAEAGA